MDPLARAKDWVELRARRGAREASSAGVAALRRAAERPSNEVWRSESTQSRLSMGGSASKYEPFPPRRNRRRGRGFATRVYDRCGHAPPTKEVRVCEKYY